MKVIARHERDDRNLELDAEQELMLEGELGLSISILKLAGITAFAREDGWSYKFED